jgi:hypothetical protein
LYQSAFAPPTATPLSNLLIADSLRTDPLLAADEIVGPFRALLALREDLLQKKFGIDADTPDDCLSTIFDEKIHRNLLDDLLALKLVKKRGVG